MKRKTFNFFISQLFCLWLYPISPLWAASSLPADFQQDNKPQNKPTAEKKTEEVAEPLYKGTFISIDLWGMGSKVLGGDFVSSEVAIDVNLKNRFFPVLEAGYGSTNAWNDNGTHYKSNAPYLRIGMNYNTLFKKKFDNYLFVGFRYAMSSFKYSVENTALQGTEYAEGGNSELIDPIWKESLPFTREGMKGTMHWAEFCVGIRAHIWKSFYMGWSLRMKYRITSSGDIYGNPWYIPGFGKYASNTLGVVYTITYKIPY